MKKKQLSGDALIELLAKNVVKNKDKIICPKGELIYSNVETQSIYTHQVYKHNTILKPESNLKPSKVDKYFKCYKVELELDDFQKTVIKKWFKSYILMYNETIKYIKINKPKSFDYKIMRTNCLKKQKEEIYNNSLIKLTNSNGEIKKCYMQSHMLDGAIKLACANYKSALTNYKNGNIRKFRIRYWKLKKDSYILDIEQCYFKGGTICKQTLGIVNGNKDGKPFNFSKILSKYKSDCKLIYEKSSRKYTLLVPYEQDSEDKITPKNLISLDPGIRTFMTGLSDNEVVKLGSNLYSQIKKKLLKIDRTANNPTISYKIKKRNISRLNRKITYLVDESHWKIINFLTNNYKNILIGDMSVKGITNNETSNIDDMTKRVAYRLKFYRFRERLSNKCDSKKINYKVIDESYTSKMCSNCGEIKPNLGGNKVYNCIHCKMTIDRDVNGCRGIYLKSFIK